MNYKYGFIVEITAQDPHFPPLPGKLGTETNGPFPPSVVFVIAAQNVVYSDYQAHCPCNIKQMFHK